MNKVNHFKSVYVGKLIKRIHLLNGYSNKSYLHD